MSLTPARPLPALGAIAVLSLGLSACGMLGDTAAPRAQITLRVADAAMNSGAPGLALRVADIVLAKQPDNAAALTARGDALYAMGQLALAGQAYRAAVKVDPRFAGAQLGLGRILVRSDPQAAEAAFLAATQLQPGNAVALSNLGVARDLQKHHAAAQEAYRAALALAPEMTDVRVNLGLSLALSGQADAAVQILRPLASDPGATQVWHADLAVALAQSGDLAGARRALVTPNDAAPGPAGVAVSDAPVAVPAPLTAVAQRDMPAPGVARAAMPPVPEARHAAMSATPDIAYAAAPLPPEVSRTPAPQAALPPAQQMARTGAAPATEVGWTDIARATEVARAGAAPAANAARADQAVPAGPAEAAPTPLLAAMMTADAGAAPQPSPPVAAAATRAPTDLSAMAVPAKAPAPVVAQVAAVPPSPAEAPVAGSPKPVPAPAAMAVAASATPAPAWAAAPHEQQLAVVHPALVSEPPVHAAAMALPSATHPGWTPWLQLASVRSEHDVPYEWHRLQTRLPDLLGGRPLTVDRAEAHDHLYWRLRTGGFASLADANALCLRIRSAGGNCFAVVAGGS